MNLHKLASFPNPEGATCFGSKCAYQPQNKTKGHCEENGCSG